MRLTTAIAILTLCASLASADEAVPSQRAVETQVAPPGAGAPARARIAPPPPEPRLITQPELETLVRSLPPILRNPHQQCVSRFQPDRRMVVRMLVRLRPGMPVDLRMVTRPRNPQLEQCLQQWTQRALVARLGRRMPQGSIATATSFPLEAEPVVDIPPQPNQNAVGVRQAIERALAGQRSIFRRCFAGGQVAGVATLRIQVQSDGTLQLMGASVPPDTGTAPLNCLAQLVATTPTGLENNGLIAQQTVEWTIQLMEPMPGTEVR